MQQKMQTPNISIFTNEMTAAMAHVIPAISPLVNVVEPVVCVVSNSVVVALLVVECVCAVGGSVFSSSCSTV